MFYRAKHENRFYGKTLEQLSVVYDEAECDLKLDSQENSLRI